MPWKADDAVLGRHVRGLLGARDEAVRRRDVDDAAPLALLHARDRDARRMKRRGQVGGDHGVPLLDRKVLDLGDELDAGIVHQHVDRPEGGFGRGDHGGDLVRLGDVGARVDRLDAELLLQPGALLLDRGRVAETIDGDVRALLGEGARDREPDARCGTGDDDGFAFEHEMTFRERTDALISDIVAALLHCNIKVNPACHECARPGIW